MKKLSHLLIIGGEGDASEMKNDHAEWGRRMLYFKDGRFATDKIFTFFAMNYIARKRNSSSGQWFVDNSQVTAQKHLTNSNVQLRREILNFLTAFHIGTKG